MKPWSLGTLELSVPVIQAPMAGVQRSALAIAVSNAGGLGSLPCALLTPDEMRQELGALRAHTDKPFNVNFFCHAQPSPDEERERAWQALLGPYYRELGVQPPATSVPVGRAPFNLEAARLIEEFRPAVVSFHFGLPAADLLGRVKATGAKVIASATTIAEGQWLEAQGVDAIIAQGLEAGGHRGMFLSNDLTAQMGTFALVPQLVSHVKVPIIAAGGIADAAGVAAAMALGASTVQVGTAYLLCPEATTSPLHRQALTSEHARHTAITNVFTGRPARGIVNRLMREIGPINPGAPAFPLASAAVSALRAAAEARGSSDFSTMWAGQNIGGCRAVAAAQLTRELADGFRR